MPISVPCQFCGKEFDIVPADLRRRGGKASCSRECRKLHCPRDPKYVRGTPEFRAYQRQRVKAWHRRNPDASRVIRCRSNKKATEAGYFNRWAHKKYHADPVAARQAAKSYRDRLQCEVIGHYGGKCALCGEARIEFLTIDHIDGGGTRHREELKRWGHSFRLWLRREGYPGDYRVLCMACNYLCELAKRSPSNTPDKVVRYYSRMKALVFSHYGQSCACCGNGDARCLCIDHIGGGGRKHRESIGGRGGRTFYQWLVSHGLPLGYRTLCVNCNFALAYSGDCPHERERVGALAH